MGNKLTLYKGLKLGEGNRAITIEKINSENIYVRLQSDFQRRIIPTQLILDILPYLRSKKISMVDFNRKYRKENNLPHLFSYLNLDYEKFLLGYEATISKLCEYELAQKENKPSPELPIASLPLPKSFVLLAGLSGTGKTRFVKQQAERFRQDASNYCIIPVRPDWHEPSDLLGYISRLGSHGAEYIVTDFLVFMIAAWKDITQNITGDELHFKESRVPYWLCLDEMNLAPVEQYFADYLAIIETRYWKEGQYYCDALLGAGVFRQVDDLARLRAKLNLEGDAHNALWEYFLVQGIGIPPNLIVAGTVNMDETTHGFSRKVIDRAFTLDFGEFFPNDYQTYFEPKTQAKTLSFAALSQVEVAMIAEYDANGIKSIEFLEAVNAVLKESSFELAYRALNELLIAVVCFGPTNTIELQAVWDDFLMTKVLPRIEGDSEKLQDRDEGSLLDKLAAVLGDRFNEIWGEGNLRPDLLREGIEGKGLKIPCRSKKKINWMRDRLSSNGFTSFWP